MKTITIDPKIFISPPYWKCPKCNAPDSFGVLMICDRHYIRRCKECRYDSRYNLPELHKKIIYIDQFAISNMMKALNPETKTYQKGSLDEFWLKLYEMLNSLCKLQLIICPGSDFHTDEALLSPYFEPLRQMYELLSHGVHFYDHETIKRFQVYEHAVNWFSGNVEKGLNLDVNSIVYGRVNVWQDRLIISVNLQYDTDWIDSLRETRGKIHEGLSEVFKRWQSEKNKTFDDWFEEESMAIGRVILQIYSNYLKRYAEIFKGQVELTVNNMIPPPSVIIIHSIQDALRKSGVQNSDIWPKTAEYLTSSSLKDIPFIKISSMLYAALARKAAAGRKEPPNRGLVNDIEFISVLLPYCEAMLIDNECRGYLNEKPLCDAINYKTKLFSQNSKDEFLEYLDEIESSASKEHLDKVNEVYGEEWRKPYTAIYRE